MPRHFALMRKQIMPIRKDKIITEISLKTNGKSGEYQHQKYKLIVTFVWLTNYSLPLVAVNPVMEKFRRRLKRK